MNESISLAYNDSAMGGGSDKVYHLMLDKSEEADVYTVVAQYGRRGSALTSQVKAAGVEYAKAKKVYDKVKREKMAKGYIEEGTAPAPQVAPSSGVKVDIKPPELLEEITNGQGPARYIGDDNYWMQDKSDGVSRGVVKAGGEIFGINKLGKPVPLPAELVEELFKINLDTFQIDAELVGPNLICRDLLVADGDISQLPYEDRYARLQDVYLDNEDLWKYLWLVVTWKGTAEKTSALAFQREERREGVVFKLKSAPYRAGRNGQHKKYKFIKSLSAIAGKPRASGKDSVELFLHNLVNKTNESVELIRCGTVSLIGKPAVQEGDIVEVEYLYAHQSSMLMVQARLKHLRNDVAPEECTTSQLIFKREEQ